MIVSIIILIISFIFDGLLTNFLPFLEGDLSLFTPMLTLTSILIIYPLFKKKQLTYYVIAFISGLLYDLFYTNLLFFNASLFLIMAFIATFIYKNFEIDALRLIVYIIIYISLYELITGVILLVFNMVPVTFLKILYKIIHSLILNILYGELLYLIINHLPKKYRRISIN